jgi:feruloyl-CoA synthase
MRRYRKVSLGPTEVQAERKPGGIVHLRSPHALGPYPAKLTERLEHWARVAPDRVLFAQRSGSSWRVLSFRDALERARRVGAALLEKGLSAERPLVVLSGNDIEHALLHLGSMYAGIPYAPISPAYSLLSTDFAKLRAIFELLTPGLVFVSNREQYGKALGAVAGGVEVVSSLAESEPSAALESAHARVGADTIVKFLFTSGSTGVPKAVINTQRMWCSNQAMIPPARLFRDPPVIVDWAPWHHTAAGNHDFGLAIQRQLVLHRRGQAHARRDRDHGAQPARGRAELVLQRAEGI